jgi:hypothetical protein
MAGALPIPANFSLVADAENVLGAAAQTNAIRGRAE